MKGRRETAGIQYQKVKLQEDYQTARIVFTHGLCAVFAICLRAMWDDWSLCGTQVC